MKSIFATLLFGAGATCIAAAQEKPLSLPDNVSDLIIDGNRAEVHPLDPNEFFPSENGKLSVSNALGLAELGTRLQSSLAQVPEGDEGKGHKDFATLKQLEGSFRDIADSKDRQSLFETIPYFTSVFSLNKTIGEMLGNACMIASEARFVYLREIAFDVSENAAALDLAKHGNFIGLFCNREIIQEPDWEDEPIPIDPAGIFIIDPNNATTKLMTKTLEEIRNFLGGNTDTGFFERYEADGDGMKILKTKYAANKAAVQAKFLELLAHVAQLEKRQ
jgi:hypothetical protein